jgi:hypothetical protein
VGGHVANTSISCSLVGDRGPFVRIGRTIAGNPRHPISLRRMQ